MKADVAYIVKNKNCLLYFVTKGSIRTLGFQSKYGERFSCRFPHGMNCVYMPSKVGLNFHFTDQHKVKRNCTLALNRIHDAGRLRETVLRFIDTVYGVTTGLIDLPIRNKCMEHYVLSKENLDRCIRVYPNRKTYVIRDVLSDTESYVGHSTPNAHSVAQEITREMLRGILTHVVTRDDVMSSISHNPGVYFPHPTTVFEYRKVFLDRKELHHEPS